MSGVSDGLQGLIFFGSFGLAFRANARPSASLSCRVMAPRRSRVATLSHDFPEGFFILSGYHRSGYDGRMDKVANPALLWRGVMNANVTQIATALEQGVDVNGRFKGAEVYNEIIQGDTPLHALFRTPLKRFNTITGRNEPYPKGAIGKAMEFLLQSKADLTALTRHGETPLMLFCQRWGRDTSAAVVDRFVKASSSVIDQKGAVVGDTALHLACQRQEDGKVKALLRHGANPEIANIHGYTPLWDILIFIRNAQIQLSSKVQYKDQKSWAILNELIKHGANINRPVQGMMPWMFIPPLPLELLSQAGADLTWKNEDGVGVICTQIEQLEAMPALRDHIGDNLRYLLDVPGVDWTAKSRNSGRDAAEVVNLFKTQENMLQLLPLVRARIQEAHLQADTPAQTSHERKPRL